MNADKKISVIVSGCRIESESVRSFELKPNQKSVLLPLATAGAHIDVILPNGLVRQYSLVSPERRDCYVIGVNLDENSRGGSRYLHGDLRVGEHLDISVPRNNFALHETAEPSVLIAGGIGITPIYAMAKELSNRGLPWTVYYCARSRDRAAFIGALEDLAAIDSAGALVQLFDDTRGAKFLDLEEVVARHATDTHYYCCGPAPLLRAFEIATTGLPGDKVHVEYFAPLSNSGRIADNAEFTVHLARSRKTLTIPSDRTILDVVLEQGVGVLHSCCEGVCGSCEVTVTEGVPDHRDHVLSPDEKAANRTMMICVSRCKGRTLTIDL